MISLSFKSVYGDMNIEAYKNDFACWRGKKRGKAKSYSRVRRDEKKVEYDLHRNFCMKFLKRF